PGPAAGVEIDLGLEVLVAPDEGAMTAVGVEPQCRRPIGVGVAGVAGQHRLVEGEAGGGLDAVADQQPPARGLGGAPRNDRVHPGTPWESCTSDQASPSSPVQVSEQQYS